MDCQNSSGAVDGLLDDLLAEILSRVPAESLGQFKCCSRACRALIADPVHRKKLPQTLEGFFHGGGRGNYGDFTKLSMRSVPLVDPSFSFLTDLLGFKNIIILDSRNGLILFGHLQDSREFGYVVCNPATKEWVPVPTSGFPPPAAPEGSKDDDENSEDDQDSVDDTGGTYEPTFLMFDPAVSSHFNLVKFRLYDDPEVVDGVQYSSETGAWSEWKRYGEGGQKDLQWASGGHIMKPEFGSAFVHGMLHFLVDHIDPFHPYKVQIVAVDGQGKTCKIIHWPDERLFSEPAFIGLSQGRLHCISRHSELDDDQESRLCIWVLEDYDTEEWARKLPVACSDLFGDMNSECMAIDYLVAAIHPDRNLLFIIQFSEYNKLISYDMDSEEVHTLRTFEHEYGTITPYVPYFTESSVLTIKTQ